jgi:hypothetical protein
MRKQRPKAKQIHKAKGADMRKRPVRSKQVRAFQDLIAAEQVLQAAIQTLVSLGAGEFTSGLSAERHRLLAKLEILQGDVYATLDNSTEAAA